MFLGDPNASSLEHRARPCICQHGAPCHEVRVWRVCRAHSGVVSQLSREEAGSAELEGGERA